MEIQQSERYNPDKPILGISVGDFNGVGPEIIVKTFLDQRIFKFCTPIVYGSGRVFNFYKKHYNLEDFHYQLIKDSSEKHLKRLNIINCWDEEFTVEPGVDSTQAGKCAYLALKKATEDLKRGKMDALVTAPVNKNNMQSEEFRFMGHTDYLAHEFQTQNYLMTFVSGPLKIAVATDHIPLSQVSQTITAPLLRSKIKILEESLKHDFGIGKPKIAVLGLNPHAGEDGLLGKEEKETIIPVINELKNKGSLVYGPYSADGFFGKGFETKFDAVLAMYHDQGLIPFKSVAFDTGVNFSAGFPQVRTSPDHGTAYDIAGKNKANESSFREAVYLALQLVKARKGHLIVNT
jgi:4-hydroxythreonine-4-phosphate dehydrogenase